MQKSWNINTAKYVTNFLKCVANNVVEHYGKRIKILQECPFEAWPNRAQSSKPFLLIQVWWLSPVKSALKRTPVPDFNTFSIMFYSIISTTYQKIVDRFCPVIFLVFHTVWLGRNQVYCSCCSAKTAHKLVLTGLASRQQALRAYCPNIYTVSKGHRQWP